MRTFVFATRVSCFLSFRLRPKLKGITQTTIDSLTGVHARLRDDFVGSTLLKDATDTRVKIFGILADHDKIDVFRRFSGKWAFDAWIELNRPKVDVLVELETAGGARDLARECQGRRLGDRWLRGR